MHTLGSLFSGVGSLDLGIEAAFDGDLTTKFHVEINEYCRQVLAKRWPHAIQHEDIRLVGAHNLPRVDILAGGFPCLGLSASGRRAGFADPQSALWFEYARIIGELRPRVAIIENSALSITPTPGSDEPAIERVLSDLAALGYNAWWTCLRAPDVGAPHRRRDRCYIVAWLADAYSDRLVELGAHDVQAHQGVEVEPGDNAARCGEVGRRRAADEPGGAGAGGVGMAQRGLCRGTRGPPGWMVRYPARHDEPRHVWEPARRVEGTDWVAKQRLLALGNVALAAHGWVIGRVAREILEAT